MPSVRDAKRKASDEFLTTRARVFRRGWSYLASANPKHNLVGIGIGPKVRGGKPTGKLAVRFYVVQKVDPVLVPRVFRFDPKIDGVPTDVIETGHLVPACNPAPGPIQNSFRPIQPGCSINLGGGSGTLGAIVERDGTKFLLTNNHVLANNKNSAIGKAVHQPLPQGSATSRIASVTDFVEIVPGGSRHVDAAIAELETAATPTPLLNTGRLASSEPVSAHRDMKVKKVGRTTGRTCGIVRDISFDYACPYSFGTVVMQDQILIEGTGNHFGRIGDSGSLVVDEDTRRATGLLYAVTFSESTLFSVACHIHNVLSDLSVRLVV